MFTPESDAVFDCGKLLNVGLAWDGLSVVSTPIPPDGDVMRAGGELLAMRLD